MTPVINNANIYTPPPTLVGGAMPGNNTLRVSPDNVPPTVSNVALNNNSQGSATALASGAAAPAATPAASSGFALSPFIYTTPTSLSAGAQNTFLAQLMSQDASPQAGKVLAQYEEMVSISFVKYKPSNATLPTPEPASIFARALQEQRQLQSVQNVVQQAVQQTAATQATTATTAAASAAPKEAAPARSENAERPVAKASAQAAASPRSAISAYLAVAARNDAAARKKPEEPVDAI